MNNFTLSAHAVKVKRGLYALLSLPLMLLSLVAFAQPQPQSITFGLIPSMPVSNPPYTLTATATSGLTVTYTSSNPSVASVSGNTVTLHTTGTSVITAFQAGDANWLPATPVERVLTVLSAPVDVTFHFGDVAGDDNPSGTPMGTALSALSRGNNFGTLTMLSNGDASTGYTNASGNYNAGATCRTGLLNLGESGYFEFTVSPEAGKRVTLYDFSFGSRSTASGPMSFTLRSSIDNYLTDIATDALTNTGVWIHVEPETVPTTAYPGMPVTYRLYGYGGSGDPVDGTANWQVDDLVLQVMVDNMESCNGTVEAGTAIIDNPGPFCATGVANLSLVGNSDPATIVGIEIQWLESTDNINFTPIPGATGISYNTGTVTQTTYYKAMVSCLLSGAMDSTDAVTLAFEEAPEITGNLFVCSGGSTLLTSTAANVYQWNLDGNPIPDADEMTYLATVGGDYSVTTTSAAGCVRTSEAVTVALVDSLVAPVITGEKNMCPYEGTGTEVTFTITPQPGVTTYNWTVPPTVNIVSGQGTESLTITILPGFGALANKQLRVTGSSSCGTTPLGIFYMASQAPVTPGFINGPDDVCPLIGTATEATYSIAAVPGATEYNWTVPAGATITSHPAGTGVNDTIITVLFDNSFVTGDIVVNAANPCGVSANDRHITVYRNNPATPSLISGPTAACMYMPTAANPTGTDVTYSINQVDGALSYNWTVPAGATIVDHPAGAGVNDTAIVVRYEAGFAGGEISVTATDNCGTSAVRTLTIASMQRPFTPGAITAVETQNCPARVVQFSLPEMPANATWVEWTVPAGALILNGQGTASVEVDMSGMISGNVTATPSNGCATGATRSLKVSYGACNPPAPFAKVPANSGFISGVELDMIDATIFPNPSTSVFRMRIKSTVDEPMTMRVLDVNGRTLEQHIMRGGEVREFGAQLKPGVYFVELIQGNTRKVNRVIKQ